jgi:hypothetical protein
MTDFPAFARAEQRRTLIAKLPVVQLSGNSLDMLSESMLCNPETQNRRPAADTDRHVMPSLQQTPPAPAAVDAASKRHSRQTT